MDDHRRGLRMSKPQFARSERNRALKTINVKIGGLTLEIKKLEWTIENKRNEMADLLMAALILENTEVIDFPTGDPQ